MSEVEIIDKETVDEEASKANARTAKEQAIQSQKDRTLFCINIDEKCTEEILFELFYQVIHLNMNPNKTRNKPKTKGGTDRKPSP